MDLTNKGESTVEVRVPCNGANGQQGRGGEGCAGVDEGLRAAVQQGGSEEHAEVFPTSNAEEEEEEVEEGDDSDIPLALIAAIKARAKAKSSPGKPAAPEASEPMMPQLRRMSQAWSSGSMILYNGWGLWSHSRYVLSE